MKAQPMTQDQWEFVLGFVVVLFLLLGGLAQLEKYGLEQVAAPECFCAAGDHECVAHCVEFDARETTR